MRSSPPCSAGWRAVPGNHSASVNRVGDFEKCAVSSGGMEAFLVRQQKFPVLIRTDPPRGNLPAPSRDWIMALRRWSQRGARPNAYWTAMRAAPGKPCRPVHPKRPGGPSPVSAIGSGLVLSVTNACSRCVVLLAYDECSAIDSDGQPAVFAVLPIQLHLDRIADQPDR